MIRPDEQANAIVLYLEQMNDSGDERSVWMGGARMADIPAFLSGNLALERLPKNAYDRRDIIAAKMMSCG